MLELKPISKESLTAAMAKANQYRLLNEPREAESICRDVLSVEPDHQPALITLLLALTDQFGKDCGVDLDRPQQLIPKLHGEYEQAYYNGVISERWGKSRPTIGAFAETIESWLQQAMGYYQQAEAIRPPGNDDAILRWNTCARMIARGTPEPRRPGGGELTWDAPE